MRLEKHNFLSYLKAKGSDLACMCCSCKTWDMVIESPVDVQDQRLMEFSLQRLAGGGVAVALVTMICTNCGLVRVHSTDKVIQTGCVT